MKTKIVFDQYVYVAAALIPNGPSAQWLRMAPDPNGPFSLHATNRIIDEVEKILGSKLSFDLIQTRAFLGHLIDCVEIVSTTNNTNDDMVIECAELCDANFIIAASKSLLGKHPDGNIGIYSPADMRRSFPVN